LYTGCSTLKDALKYLEKYTRYGKTFQMKIVWSEGGHITIKLIFKKIYFSRKYEAHISFFEGFLKTLS